MVQTDDTRATGKSNGFQLQVQVPISKFDTHVARDEHVAILRGSPLCAQSAPEGPHPLSGLQRPPSANSMSH